MLNNNRLHEIWRKYYWFIFFELIFGFILLLTVLASFESSFPMLAILSRKILAPLCHQRPDRSFAGLGLCARCFSIYLTLFLGSLLGLAIGYSKLGRIPLWVKILLAIPMPINGALPYFNAAYDTPSWFRSLTGVLFSFAIISFFFPIIDRLNREIIELQDKAREGKLNH
jgi:uncharacterized membrane protein